MIELELDGKTVSAEPGSTILEVALREGRYVPHFCYHKKLSIAANCRMCLVEVEKAPKPQPACATPIAEGMKVHTCSKVAVEAQQGVMEFLLINHPLDCPICDQGGECQLQDLAVGYGKSKSRFNEEKRAVSNKDLGPLVATEMTRCIHCSRCVRFTEEIAGFQSLGMSYRNNHVEVMPFIGKTVDSEISGNIIDLCPVGALTSKPFRNQYRSWELSRRKTIAPHDGLGSNLIAQVDKYHKVVRMLPSENEELNECWLSDRDRFSYEGLNHEERATTPMIKQDGKWHEVDWEVAVNYAAKAILGVKHDHEANKIGVLASRNSTTEELYLLQKLMRDNGIYNLDSRLSRSDFSLDASKTDVNYLGDSVANAIDKSRALLVIGSMLREEQPLIAQRIRQAVKRGTSVHVVNVVTEDLLMDVANQVTLDPRAIVNFLAQIAKALNANVTNCDLSKIEVSEEALAIANSLKESQGYIVLGEIAKNLPNYSQIAQLAQALSQAINGNFGAISSYANEVGACLVGMLPYQGAFNEDSECGLNVSEMLNNDTKAFILFNTEPEHDCYNPALALKALEAAQTVIVFSPYMSAKMQEYADVILPITPFTETAGSFVNMAGLWQQFNGVTRPLGDAKPGWKVLRVLANALQTPGFDYNSITDVRNELELLNDTSKLLTNDISLTGTIDPMQLQLDSLVRIGIQGSFAVDNITRRAESLQQTYLGQKPKLVVSPKLAAKLALKDGVNAQLSQDGIAVEYNVAVDQNLPESVVFFAAEAGVIGSRFGSVSVS